MAFTDKQLGDLRAKLDASNVKERTQGKQSLSYIEGWHVIAEANRIFGFDCWDRVTLETTCVAERERKIGRDQYQKDGWGVTYTARVRVTVRAGEALIVREGVGSGHGIDADLGLAHESAIKEAETDAMKRALMTFGNPFGLALYDKSRENVETAAPASQQRPAAAPPRQQPDAPPVKAAYIVKGKDAADFAARVIALVQGAPNAVEIQAINDANAPWLDKLRINDKALWDSVMAAMSTRTTNVMEQAA